jgi:hypothetical protein
MKADTEKTKLNPGMMQTIGEHQEVPMEEATVMLVSGLRKERKDQNLAMVHSQKPKGRNQASRDSWMRLTVTGREVSRCAKMAW